MNHPTPVFGVDSSASILGQPGVALYPGEFRRIQEMIYAAAGIRLPNGKQALVQNRLMRHVERLKLASYSDYLDLLERPQGEEEKLLFIDSLTTNETFFFRHKQHWDFFIRVFIAWAKDRNPTDELRVWSAASSIGCEAYSAAMLLEEHLPSQYWNWRIEGTDLSRKVLEAATAGVYEDYALQKVSDYAKQRYFIAEASEFKVRDEIRKRVKFVRHNLLDARGGLGFHLIFLRNVLFYFDDKSRREVVRKTVSQLLPNGYLLLGGAESLPEEETELRMLEPGIYRKKGKDAKILRRA